MDKIEILDTLFEFVLLILFMFLVIYNVETRLIIGIGVYYLAAVIRNNTRTLERR